MSGPFTCVCYMTFFYPAIEKIPWVILILIVSLEADIRHSILKFWRVNVQIYLKMIVRKILTWNILGKDILSNMFKDLFPEEKNFDKIFDIFMEKCPQDI